METKSLTNPSHPSPNPSRRIPCEVFTRCVGYLRPVSAMHAAKQQEVKDRVPFEVPELLPATAKLPLDKGGELW